MKQKINQYLLLLTCLVLGIYTAQCQVNNGYEQIGTVTFVPMSSNGVQIFGSLNNRYQLASNVRNGSASSVDRNYSFSDLPSAVRGCTYVKTAMNDKNYMGPENMLSLSLPGPVIVYVGYDERYDLIPNWLRNFKKLDETYPLANTRYRLYEKRFEGGIVNFGPNKPTANAGNYGMYSVFLKDAEKGEEHIRVQGIEEDPYFEVDKPVITTTKLDKGGEVIQKLISKPSFTEGIYVKSQVDCPETESGITCTVQKRRFQDASIDHFLKKSNEVMESPGVILDGNDLFTGKYRNIQPSERKPFSVFIKTAVAQNTNASQKIQIRNPASKSEMAAALSQLKMNLPTRPTEVADAVLNVSKIESETDSKLKLGGSFNSPWVDVNSVFSFNNKVKTQKYLLEYAAEYYSVFFEKDQDAFYNEHVKPDPSWVYVDQVKYGKRLYFTIETTENINKIDSELKVKGAYGPVKAGFELASIQNREFKEVTVKQIVQGGNVIPVSGKFPENIIDILAKTKYSAYNPGAPISSVLRFVHSDEIAQVATTADYTERVCFRTSNSFKVNLEGIECVAQDDNGNVSELFGSIDMWVQDVNGRRFSPVRGNFSGTRAWTLVEDDADDHGVLTTGSELRMDKFQIFKIPLESLQHATLYIKGKLWEEDSGGDDYLGERTLKIPLRNIPDERQVGSPSSIAVQGQYPVKSPRYTDGEGIQSFYIPVTITPIIPKESSCGK